MQFLSMVSFSLFCSYGATTTTTTIFLMLLFPQGDGERSVAMEDFWAMVLAGLKVWVCVIVALLMVPAMFGFSLGISETYMKILVKILEVKCVCPEVADHQTFTGTGVQQMGKRKSNTYTLFKGW